MPRVKSHTRINKSGKVSFVKTHTRNMCDEFVIKHTSQEIRAGKEPTEAVEIAVKKAKQEGCKF